MGADERLRRGALWCLPKRRQSYLAALGASRWHHAVISASPTERNLAVNLWYDLQALRTLTPTLTLTLTLTLTPTP